MNLTASTWRIAGMTIGALALIVVPIVQAETPVADPWKQEMERKLNLLTQELEKSKLEPAEEPVTQTAGQEYGRGASKIYRRTKGVSFGGYGEMVYSYFDHERENKTPSDMKAQSDLLR